MGIFSNRFNQRSQPDQQPHEIVITIPAKEWGESKRAALLLNAQSKVNIIINEHPVITEGKIQKIEKAAIVVYPQDELQESAPIRLACKIYSDDWASIDKFSRHMRDRLSAMISISGISVDAHEIEQTSEVVQGRSPGK